MIYCIVCGESLEHCPVKFSSCDDCRKEVSEHGVVPEQLIILQDIADNKSRLVTATRMLIGHSKYERYLTALFLSWSVSGSAQAVAVGFRKGVIV